jgi:hypothetical protein
MATTTSKRGAATDRSERSPTTEQVWKALEKATFAVVGHVTPEGEPRSSGVICKAIDQRLYFVTAADSWKAKHLAESGRASATVLVRRGGILSLLFPIPPATICLHGAATVHEPGTAQIPDALAPLLPEERRRDCAVVEIIPEGNFLTYGIGVPLMKMRDTARSRAHVAVR